MAQEKQSGDHRKAAQHIQEKHTGLVLTGRIRNGSLELDQDSVDEIARKFPQADISFVALNSPFDPDSQSVQ